MMVMTAWIGWYHRLSWWLLKIIFACWRSASASMFCLVCTMLGLLPPPFFLRKPDKPVMCWPAWKKVFQNYLIVCSSDGKPSVWQNAVLYRCPRTEDQRVICLTVFMWSTCCHISWFCKPDVRLNGTCCTGFGSTLCHYLGAPALHYFLVVD